MNTEKKLQKTSQDIFNRTYWFAFSAFSIHFNLFFVNFQYFHQIKPVVDESFVWSHENTDTAFWESFLEIQNDRFRIRNFLLLMNWLRVCSSGVNNICYSGINWLFSWKAVCRHLKFLSMFIYHDYQKFLHAEIDWPSTKLIWNNSINPKFEGEKSDIVSNKQFLIYYQCPPSGPRPAKAETHESSCKPSASAKLVWWIKHCHWQGGRVANTLATAKSYHLVLFVAKHSTNS